MRHQLIEIVPNYQKGDETAIRKIAAEYPKAVERGRSGIGRAAG